VGGILHIELNNFFVPHLKSRHKTPPLFYVNVECISNIVGNLFLSAFTCIALINFLRKEPWPTVCACSFRETLNKPITGFVGSLFMEACVICNVAQFRGDTKYLPMGFVWKLYMEACSICILHCQVCNLSIHAQHLSSLKIALVGFIFPSRVWTNGVQVNFKNHIYTDT
jgi:hypothetical protein